MIQTRLTKIGLGKQTAKGAAVANPTFNFGLFGGNVVKTELTEEDLNPTWTTRMLEGRERTLVIPGAEYDFAGMPKSIGAHLLAALGTVTTTGAGPFSHTFKVADDLPYWNAFATSGSVAWHKLKDLKLDELELSFEAAAALRCKAKWIGCDVEFLAAAPTGGADERPGLDGVLSAAGGLFQVDGASLRVKSGSVKFSNGVEVARDATKVIPDDVFPGSAMCTVSLTVLPDDLLTYRKVITGATNGTTVAVAPLSGSCLLKWVKDATTDLIVNVNKFYYAVNTPEANPDGGPAEITIEGVAAVTAAGNPYDAVLRNTQATY